MTETHMTEIHNELITKPWNYTKRSTYRHVRRLLDNRDTAPASERTLVYADGFSPVSMMATVLHACSESVVIAAPPGR